ncbi:MAG: phosphate ABC transporter substrate-binding protein [Candidatus Omnitrophica bacterium]|jgi:phosphate transport system substrate-binding protein|nr:phosphate ABC transporter substrate-binding protein [Candidatus Omnitrophota bacterium]MDD3274515.1 phosphate ABC transporter substrate-binding protein [Candidatus Omnitrophota bacterium]
MKGVKMKKIGLLVLTGIIGLGLLVPCYAEKIVIEGSTTVLPIAQRAAEVYMDQNPGANISVRGGGSGVGIASLLDKSCDIADASRPIKDKELDKAVTNGVDATANIVAMDGLAVIVNASNNVSKMSKKQVKDIFTGKISNWSQVGGSDEKIVVVSRDTSSGTFEAFLTMVLSGDKTRPDALMQASNQAVATTIASTPGAIGYVGLGFISPSVKAVEIDGVMPSKETVVSGKYPITRPLFMYTNGKPKGAVKEFIDFILSDEGQKIVEEEGFVGLREKK